MIDAEYDALIVGGGLMGLLAARALSDAGLSIAVLERGALGSEASWAGGGILSPLYPWRYPESVSALAEWGQRAYPELCRALAQETGIDPEWTPSGLLVLDPGDGEEGASWAARRGAEYHRLSGPELREKEPALSESLIAGPDMQAAWLPQIAQVRSPRLLKALCSSLRARGVALYENTAVDALSMAQRRVSGVSTAAGEVRANRVIIAAGAWSGGLMASLGIALPLVPIRGQMLLFQGRPGLLRHIVLYRDRYLIPRRDGHVLVGSTLEQAGFDKTTTATAEHDLRDAALNMVPDLADCQIERQWAGLRPGSPAGVPYIGAHPAVAGLYICTGHYRNGLVLGLASSRLLADLILGGTLIVNPQPYALTA